MFKPRYIASHSEWLDIDGIKIYTISTQDQAVDHDKFSARLNTVKTQNPIPWHMTPAFSIYHEGETFLYLILAWWGNDNELFTSVSVLTDHGWVEDAQRYSFCVYDLEVFWAERNFYIETVYCKHPSIDVYRSKRYESL